MSSESSWFISVAVTVGIGNSAHAHAYLLVAFGSCVLIFVLKFQSVTTGDTLQIGSSIEIISTENGSLVVIAPVSSSTEYVYAFIPTTDVSIVGCVIESVPLS